MKVLLNYFVDLCLLRAAPQDLPDSSALVGLAFIANVLVGALLIVGARMGPMLSFLESLLEVALMLLVLRTGLTLRRRQARFDQTATAVMGSSSLIGLVALPLLNLGTGEGEGSALGAILLLGLIVWSMVVLGHIIRHAFDLLLGQGIIIGVLYTLGSYMIVASIFPIN